MIAVLAGFATNQQPDFVQHGNGVGFYVFFPESVVLHPKFFDLGGAIFNCALKPTIANRRTRKSPQVPSVQ